MFRLYLLSKIPEYEKYCIDLAAGDIFSIKSGRWKLLKPYKIQNGNLFYFAVNLYNENGRSKVIKVHKLVTNLCPLICGDWFEGCVVNHKDENTLNNSCFNLEVCTVAYNNSYGGHNQRVWETNVKNGRYSGFHCGTEEYRKWLKEYMKEYREKKKLAP